MSAKISRRDFLKAGLFTAAGTAGAAALLPRGQARGSAQTPGDPGNRGHADMMAMPVGEVDHQANGFNPTELLYDFDYGRVSTLENGQTLHEYEVTAVNQQIEVLPGIPFPAWTYNGRLPGPTLRATEGDRIRIHFSNATGHPHSMHFHGIHPYIMDGVPETPGMINPGERFTYEFDAEPFGLHLYHCHAFPLARHIAKGLYGAFIVDPPGGRPPADREMVMVMHGYDVDFDDTNDFYAVNGIPFHYAQHPIRIRVGELVRVYLVNILEFDLLNSFHLHANFFQYYPTGTSLEPIEYTDTIMQTQAQRGILEFRYKYPGRYMFHAHNTEFAELGWTGFFEVLDVEGEE